MTKVLVVDDEPQIARALRINLAAGGYDLLKVAFVWQGQTKATFSRFGSAQ